jgi:hypothetical protein
MAVPRQPTNPGRIEADTIRTNAARGLVTEHHTSADGVLRIESILRPWAIALPTRQDQ